MAIKELHRNGNECDVWIPPKAEVRNELIRQQRVAFGYAAAGTGGDISALSGISAAAPTACLPLCPQLDGPVAFSQPDGRTPCATRQTQSCRLRLS